MNNFKVTKCGKYFKTKIIKFKPANYTIKYAWPSSNLHENRESTEVYMQFVLDMENQVKKELKSQGLDFEPILLVVHGIKLICSWSEGFDIRHDIGLKKQAKLVVKWYKDAYDKAKLENDILFKKISSNGKGGYEHKNWKEDERYNYNNKLYELGMENLEEYYGKDRLDRMSDTLDELKKSTDELLAKIKKYREDKEASRENEMKGVKVGDNILIPSASNKKDEPDIIAVVEELVENNVVKARIHDKLSVIVPTRMIKFNK